jgi:putative membrane protein
MRVLSVLVRWVVLAVAVVLSAWVTPDVTLSGGPVAAMWVAILIALANVLAGLVIRVLPKPSALVLLAALTLAVNGLAVWVVSAFTDYLTVDGFLPAVMVTIMISVFSLVLTALLLRLLPDEEKTAETGRR